MDNQKNPANPAQGNPENPFGEVIFAYTRAQALADGVLVDVTGPARQAGFAVRQNPGLGSVAMTETALRAAVRDSAVMPDLVAVFAALVLAIRARPDSDTRAMRPGEPDRLDFTVTGADGKALDLYAHCGPGDDPRPVVTVMLSDED